MSNGRMTFRFDAGKDKPKELQPEPGPEETKQEQRAEVYSLDEARRTAGGGRQDSITGPLQARDRTQDREYRLEELEQAYNNKKKFPGSGANQDRRIDEGNRGGQGSSGPGDRWDIAATPDREDIAGDPYGPGADHIPEWTAGLLTGKERETDTELLRDAFLRSRPGEDLRRGQMEAEESYAGFDYGSPAYTEGASPDSSGPRREWLEEPEDAGGGYYTTRRTSSWWKFPASVAGAIGIGLLLGYAALTFIGGVHDGGSVGTASPGTAAQQNAVGNSTSAPAVPVQVPAQSYYLLQYGVFSTPEGAAQAQQELESAGLAAGLDPEDGNRVYAGLSSDREQAKLLGSRLKAKGIDLYVKEVSLPSENQLVFGGNGETVTRYFNTSGELLSELSSLSASLLGGDTAADTAKVSDLHLQWTETVKALEAGLPSGPLAAAKELEKSVSRGVSAMNEYSKSKADGLLWEVQAAMLDMLSGQKRLLASMEQG
ncbi:Sporulation related domain-containing protein [Paenibacillus sophorae]|uniref:SPOR domain-containing protein n=1 Tax=Paenibacillus sophorae TaxID=1333845 RepID=A0A1H8QK45_9BACL|nr:SPOR domain-containing protein [Paenibacillus sophorae]QWU15095.1 SPOR domain-containing protein [Paenibacillus sophorae]SEO54605.1 Sporulation related domain-containing protein [Paenibacillus sophorae]